ncbi:MAG: acyltransferase [Nitrospira sp.]
MRHQTGNRMVYLDSLRGMAIGMVVATHALGYSQLTQENAQLIGFLSRIVAVPAFFLVDGLLFATGHQYSASLNYGGYVRKSARRLLVPWMVFTFAYCALRMGFEYLDSHSARVVYGQNWHEVLLAAYLSTCSSQMYFLLSLFFIRTASTITYRATRVRPVHQIAIAVTYIVLFHTLPLQSWFFAGLDPIYHALWGMQFYLIGVVLVPWIPVLRVPAARLSAVAITTGLLLASLFDGMTVPSQLLLLFGSYFFFFSHPDRFPLLSSLGQSSMGIYLLHIPLVMKIFSLMLSRLLSPSTLLFFILLTMATLAASALFTKLLLQFPFGRIIFGESTRTSPPRISAQ